MATPHSMCLLRNTAQERSVPEFVIDRMYRSFYMPYYYEGWDHIDVIYPEKFSRLDSFDDFVWLAWNYNQHNSHHKLPLGKHSSEVRAQCSHWSDDAVTLIAAELHDVGKLRTQTFKNTKGEYTNEAHYYNHHHVGAYTSMFYESPDPVEVATIIQWHMQPFVWESKQSQKLNDKYRKLWGDKLYEKIMLIHRADQLST